MLLKDIALHNRDKGIKYFVIHKQSKMIFIELNMLSLVENLVRIKLFYNCYQDFTRDVLLGI